MKLNEALRVARAADAHDPLGCGAEAADALETLATAVERVRELCNGLEAAGFQAVTIGNVRRMLDVPRGS